MRDRFVSVGRLVTTAAGAVLLGACGTSEPGEVSAASELPFFSLSEPTLEIGVIDGADEYIFGAIESVVRLGDGTIGVSDAGATRVSVFDGSGTFLRSWGEEGGGPQEFRSLSRIYPHGADSLMAADRATSRVSVFDLDGSLGGQIDGVDLSGDELFKLDSWLHGRFWVNGALMADDRARVAATLDGFPPPRLSPGYRVVLVDADGDLWIREPRGGGQAGQTWTRTGPDGTPVAAITMPTGFRPTHIEDDDLLGVWTGEADVNFVRAYRLVDTGETRPVPAWLGGSESAVTAEVAPDEEELMDQMRDAIRMLASAQEIHYSSNMSYTTDVASLERFEQPESIDIDFAHGTPRGWAAVFTHPAVDRVCALAYGFDIPPGWTPGMIICGPPATSGSPSGG